MKPIIGVFAAVDDGTRSFVLQNYLDSVEAAGGLPVVLPYTKSKDALQTYAELCHGFLLVGGVDIAPERYSAERQKECGTVCDARDEFEFAAFDAVYPTEKPILGICRGCQLINVALGGTLYQDIPTAFDTEVVHRQTEAHHVLTHEVVVVPDTPLHAATGKENFWVNTFHHQSVERTGKGLAVMATAPCGIVEAVYAPARRFLWGVQWHPERTYAVDENSRVIFSMLVSASRAD